MNRKVKRGALGIFTLVLWAGCSAEDDASQPTLSEEIESAEVELGLPGSEAAQQLGEANQELRIGRQPCRSTSDCKVGHCTTEDGDCNRPPGCGAGDICPAVCYGVCAIDLPTPCGNTTCSMGEFCCNASCNTCAPIGGACTQQICESPI